MAGFVRDAGNKYWNENGERDRYVWGEKMEWTVLRVKIYKKQAVLNQFRINTDKLKRKKLSEDEFQPEKKFMEEETKF